MPAVVAIFAAAAAGLALAEGLARAKTSDAFFLWPTFGNLAFYGLGVALLTALTFAFEIGGPPVAARGGRMARRVRAVIRRRLRHGRTRADIARAEVGLTLSVCTILLAAGSVLATRKLILVMATIAAIGIAAASALSLCRLVGYDPLRSALVGLLLGLALGGVVS